MKILLLQARNADDPAKEEERVSFATKAKLPLDAFVPFDLLQGPPTVQQGRQVDAVMIGGSGEYDVSKANLPHFTATLVALANLVEAGVPIFASCFGFQLLTQALGGEIVDDADHMEVGTFPLTLTEVGRHDALFSYLPSQFNAQLGRKDRAHRLPDGAINLASSARSPYQAFRLEGKLVWATQFHPELSKDENLLRYERYMKMYSRVMTADTIARTRAGFLESKEAEELIPRFIGLLYQQHHR